MFGSKFSLYECLKFIVHWSSLAMSRIRNSAAAAASCLDLNSGAVGLRGVASFDLSHNNSRGYKCCMALSRTVFWVRTLAERTTLSRPAISFCMIPSGQQFSLLTEDSLNFHTSGGVVLVVLIDIQRTNGTKSHLYSFEGISLVSWGPFLSDDTTAVLAKC